MSYVTVIDKKLSLTFDYPVMCANAFFRGEGIIVNDKPCRYWSWWENLTSLGVDDIC